MLSLFAVLAVCACSTTSNRLSMRELAVAPPSLMTAQKNPRTLYLVLDPAKVPAEMTVLVGGKDQGGRLTDVAQFVARDLKKAFEAFFAKVQVVAPEQVGTEPAVIADVKLDRIEVLVAGSRPDGILTVYAGASAVTWGFAIRPSEAHEYLYSFAGESVGSTGETPELVFRSMFEAAIAQLLKGYTDQRIDQKLLALPAPPPDSAATTRL
ncbi:MAG: hypothetical protein IPJ65_21260 [Archangiaceae bacterium]|nr:hypothetical protein [Archangiaceae bacterium]